VNSSALQSVQATSLIPTKPNDVRSRKRKRTTLTDLDDEPQFGAEVSEEEEEEEEEEKEGAQVKRRRETSSLKDRIRELETELAATNEKLTAANEMLRALAGRTGTSISRSGG